MEKANDYTQLISFLENYIKKIQIENSKTFRLFKSKYNDEILNKMNKLLVTYYEKYYMSIVEEIDFNYKLKNKS